jgi:hypothetical protein
MRRDRPHVRVLMMQKNEGDVLARWLAHYGGLFGFQNLHLIDNGSSDPLTLLLLQEAEKRGATLYHGLTTQHDFQNKGGHFTNIIRHWDKRHDHDFVLPVDCDEILAVFTRHGLTTDHDEIANELDRLLPIRCALRLDMSLFNVPDRPGWFCPDRFFHKGFLPAGSLDVLDNGQHAPKSRLAEGHVTTRLTYLHFHNRPYEIARQRARSKLSDLVDVDDPDALARYAQQQDAPGAHLLQMLSMSKEDYLRRYDKEVKVFVPDAGDVTLVSCDDKSWIWDSDRYIDDHPDVRFYALSPLHHYLRHGFLEGRKAGQVGPA